MGETISVRVSIDDEALDEVRESTPLLLNDSERFRLLLQIGHNVLQAHSSIQTSQTSEEEETLDENQVQKIATEIGVNPDTVHQILEMSQESVET